MMCAGSLRRGGKIKVMFGKRLGEMKLLFDKRLEEMEEI